MQQDALDCTFLVACIADGANPLLEVFESERQKRKREKTPFRNLYQLAFAVTVDYLVAVEGRGLRSRRTRGAVGAVGEGGGGAEVVPDVGGIIEEDDLSAGGRCCWT